MPIRTAELAGEVVERGADALLGGRQSLGDRARGRGHRRSDPEAENDREHFRLLTLAVRFTEILWFHHLMNINFIS
jgi:hypothetical protein